MSDSVKVNIDTEENPSNYANNSCSDLLSIEIGFEKNWLRFNEPVSKHLEHDGKKLPMVKVEYQDQIINVPLMLLLAMLNNGISSMDFMLKNLSSTIKD